MSGALPRDNALEISNLRVVPRTAKVKTSINSLIIASMEQVRCPLAFTQRANANKVVACRN